MTDAHCLGAFNGLLNPLYRQMLSQSVPVRRFEAIYQEMESVIKSIDAQVNS